MPIHSLLSLQDSRVFEQAYTLLHDGHRCQPCLYDALNEEDTARNTRFLAPEGPNKVPVDRLENAKECAASGGIRRRSSDSRKLTSYIVWS